MAEFDILCADDRVVTMGIPSPTDPVHHLLKEIKRYYGLDSETVMNTIFGVYPSGSLTFYIEPHQIHAMLLSFWAGLEVAHLAKESTH
jgi:hypothetical protein